MQGKITNKILIPVLIMVFLLLLLAMYLIKDSGGGPLKVRVLRGSDVIEEKEISSLEKSCVISLETNTIVIEKGGVYMKDASCPDKLCVKQGRIDKKGECIVCLPNRIMVEIVGNKADVDAVAGAK